MVSPIGPLDVPHSSTIRFQEASATTQVVNQVAFPTFQDIQEMAKQSKQHAEKSESSLRVVRGGQGVDYVVKVHEKTEEGSWLKAIGNVAGKTIATAGLALLHPGTWRAFSADRSGTRKSVEYSTNITEAERAQMEDQLHAFYAMKVGAQSYDVRKQGDRTQFAQAEFDANPDRFTHVRGKGHYYIDQQHSRILIVPDGNNGRPDFSKTESYHVTDLKDVAIKDRLHLERAGFQALQAQDEIARGLRAGIDKKLSVLLTDDSLRAFRREMLARMTRILGYSTTSDILKKQYENMAEGKEKNLIEAEHAWLDQQQKRASRNKAKQIKAADFQNGRLLSRANELRNLESQARNEEVEQQIDTLRKLICTDMRKAKHAIEQLFSVNFPNEGNTPTFPRDLNLEACRYASTEKPEEATYSLFWVDSQDKAARLYWQAVGQRHLDTLQSYWLPQLEKADSKDKLDKIGKLTSGIAERSEILQTNPGKAETIATAASQLVALHKLLASLPASSPERATLQKAQDTILKNPAQWDNECTALYNKYKDIENPSEEQKRIREALTPPEPCAIISCREEKYLVPGEARVYQVANQLGVLQQANQYGQSRVECAQKIAKAQFRIRQEWQPRLATAATTAEKTELEAHIANLEQQIQASRTELKQRLELLNTQRAPYQPLLEAAKQEGILLQDYALAKKKLENPAIAETEKEQIQGQAYTALHGLVKMQGLPPIEESEKITAASTKTWSENIKNNINQGSEAKTLRLKTLEELHIQQQKAIQGLSQESFKTLVIDPAKKRLVVGNEELVFNPKEKRLERSVDFRDRNAGISIKATDSFWTQVEQSYKDKFNEQIEKPELRQGREGVSRTPTTLKLDEEEAKKSPLGDLFNQAKGGISKLFGFDD